MRFCYVAALENWKVSTRGEKEGTLGVELWRLGSLCGVATAEEWKVDSGLQVVVDNRRPCGSSSRFQGFGIQKDQRRFSA